MALREDHFAGSRLLRQDLPRRRAFLRHGRPPMRGIPRIAPARRRQASRLERRERIVFETSLRGRGHHRTTRRHRIAGRGRLEGRGSAAIETESSETDCTRDSAPARPQIGIARLSTRRPVKGRPTTAQSGERDAVSRVPRVARLSATRQSSGTQVGAHSQSAPYDAGDER